MMDPQIRTGSSKNGGVKHVSPIKIWRQNTSPHNMGVGLVSPTKIRELDM